MASVQTRVRFVRSYTRTSERSFQAELPIAAQPLFETSQDGVVSSFGQLSQSTAGEQFPKRPVDRHSDSNDVNRNLAESSIEKNISENPADRNVLESALHRQRNDSVVVKKFDEKSVGRKLIESVVDREFTESVAGSVWSRTLCDSFINGKRGSMDRQSVRSIVDNQVAESAVDKKFVESVVDEKLGEGIVDRPLTNRQALSRNLNRKFSDSTVDRKVSDSLMIDKVCIDSAQEGKFLKSNIGRNSRRLSVKLTPLGHSRTSRAIRIASRNQTDQPRKSRLGGRGGVSRLADRGGVSSTDHLSRNTVYYHGDFVDENLLISAARLDSTLVRLFSHARENEGHPNGEQDPGLALMPFLNYSQSDLISMEAVLWRVFPMESAQREALDQELPYMEVHMAPSTIMRHLHEKAILTHMDYNQLSRTEGQGDKAVTRLMVRTLQRRGHKAYPAFLEALQAHSYTHILQRLSETERSLRDAMAADRSDSRHMWKTGDPDSHHNKPTKTPLPRPPSVFAFNQTVTMPILTSSSNQVPFSDSDAILTNHICSFVDHQTPVGGAEEMKQPISLEDNNMAAHDFHIANSKQLEKQLTELMAEFESLQKEILAIKSAPSRQDWGDNHSNNLDVETDLPQSRFPTQEPSSMETTSSASSSPECEMETTPVYSSPKRAQKSVSCNIL